MNDYLNCLWKQKPFSSQALHWIETTKEQHLFAIEIICDIINLSNVDVLINAMHPDWIKVFIFSSKKKNSYRTKLTLTLSTFQ